MRRLRGKQPAPKQSAETGLVKVFGFLAEPLGLNVSWICMFTCLALVTARAQTAGCISKTVVDTFGSFPH